MKCVLAVLGMVGTLGLAQGCMPHACTLMGWSEGLTVNVTSEQPLTPGVYHFLIEIPNRTFEADLTLEAPANTEEGVVVSQGLEQGNWRVGVSLAGSTDSGVLGGVTLETETGGPESLTLTVLQDEVEIGKLKLDSIAYQSDEPNGPGCGVRTTATASIAIAPVQ